MGVTRSLPVKDVLFRRIRCGLFMINALVLLAPNSLNLGLPDNSFLQHNFFCTYASKSTKKTTTKRRLAFIYRLFKIKIGTKHRVVYHYCRLSQFFRNRRYLTTKLRLLFFMIFSNYFYFFQNSIRLWHI